jgi:uncharacterized protein YkwD
MNSVIRSAAHARSLRVVVILAAALTLCTTYTDAPARQQKPKPRVEAADLAKRLHTQVNKERKKRGLAALAWSDALSRIAAKHSRDMANRNYLSHDSPEGKDFSFRYQQGGYVCVIRVGKMVYAGAENIALSHLYNSMTTENGIAYYNWNSAQEIIQKTVDGWMNSPGHRENILMPYWQHEGIGIEIESSPGNKIYITQNFC